MRTFARAFVVGFFMACAFMSTMALDRIAKFGIGGGGGGGGAATCSITKDGVVKTSSINGGDGGQGRVSGKDVVEYYIGGK